MARFVKHEDWTPSDGIILEDAARAVVTSVESRSVIAGPGAGKTELLAQRALYLLQTGACKPPQRILAISFKRDAAKNLKDRVSKRCSPEMARRFDSFTFDAFAKSIVDRFRRMAPAWCRPQQGYQVLFPTRDHWQDFLRGVDVPKSLGRGDAAAEFKLASVEKWGPLPREPHEFESLEEWAAFAWWLHCLSGEQPGVSFPMINRLAESILRYNPQVVNALRLTYSHVFLDEFQDTTGMQYALTEQMFHGSHSVLTAVGDTKQRIMSWAGAEAQIFSRFEQRFQADRLMLQMNHRSNQRIVQLINDLVVQIEPHAVKTICGRKDSPVPENPTGFWVFQDDATEARWIANFIAEEINRNVDGSLTANDFALLVRVKANQAEDQLARSFAACGLRLRNEARLVHGIALQELMAESLAQLVIGLVRLALGIRGRDIYIPIQEAIGGILGTDYGNAAHLKRLDSLVRGIISKIQQATATPPPHTDMRGLVQTIVAEIGADPLRRMYRQYDNEEYFQDVQNGLAALMMEYGSAAGDWHQVIDGVEGKGQVKLMTVHKSKGLEYHTVIFVGLHQNAFFGYRNNQEEETNTFFVALSRARERVFFTRSVTAGDTRQIQGLIDLLERAKVPAHGIL